jgi:hypothetical protein
MTVKDKYVIRYGSSPKPVCVVECVRTTKTLAVCQRISGVRGYKEYRLPVGYNAADETELAAAYQEINNEIERNRRHRERERQLESDPHHQLVNRFKNGDLEPWDKLALDQLKTIAGWLDNAT